MNVLARLRKDHAEILAELDRLETMLNHLKREEIASFISRFQGLVLGLEKHEEFEDLHLFVPLAEGGADAAILNHVDRARREHLDVLVRLVSVHRWMSDGRGLTPKKWTEGHREMIRALVGRAYGELRDHIRWENEALLSPDHGEPPEERESWRRWN